ncbi:MAG: hypothetical protein COA58_02580 [Bacteroidetes bacterium]|nr:MAG: hypothetical protein COA58_02580 [Bacteroidota bacterium]
MLKISAVIWYEVNQTYIASELCEQKEVLDNKCLGNCQLSQKLQLTDQSNEENPSKVNVQIEVLNFVLPSEEVSNEYLLTISGDYRITLTIGDEIPFVSKVFRPPAC